MSLLETFREIFRRNGTARKPRRAVVSFSRWQSEKEWRTENMYQAARMSKKRAAINVAVQDSRYDASADVRTVLIGKSRYYAENNPFVSKILEVIDSYVNGVNGLNLEPDTGRERSNRIAQKCWAEWVKECDFSGKLKFHYLTSLALRQMLVDGECFIVLRDCPGEKVQRKIQLLEAHRCRNPRFQEKRNVVDGIRYDFYGRPTHYYLVDGMDSGAEPKEFPADRVIHVYSPSRAGQLRGIPAATPVLSTLQDFEMIEEAEIGAVKANAGKYAIVETPTGEAFMEDIQESLARGEEVLEKGDDVFVHPLPERDHRILEENFGGEVLFVREGVKWNQNSGERPSKVVQEFWVYLVEKVCIGFNVAKILIFPQSLQGTTARAEIAATEAMFKSLFSILEDVALKCYGWAMSGYASKFPLNCDYTLATVTPPRELTADVARESGVMLSEYKNGVNCLQDLTGKDGKNSHDVMRKRAEDYLYAVSLCKDMGVPDVRLVYNPLSETTAEHERIDLGRTNEGLKNEANRE